METPAFGLAFFLVLHE